MNQFKKPNIIYFFCDELRTDAIGCYGHSYAKIKTPNIDKIASNGVRFNHCYCNSPVCVPSRTSIMTGLYPEDTGVYHNEANWKNFRLQDHNLSTFPEVLAENGYITASFGKTHLPLEMHPFNYENREGGSNWLKNTTENITNPIKPNGIGTLIGGEFSEDCEYPPEKVTENALQWIKNSKDSYFARVSYLQPHTPVIPKPPFSRMYDGEAFPKEINTNECASEFEKRFSQVVDTTTMTQQDIYLSQVHYYGLTSWVDEQIGKILDYLQEKNQLDNTIIIFGADHGASLGEGGCYAKHIFAPQSHKVPLIISYPKSLPKGVVEEKICENLDLSKTLFSLINVEAPKQFKGRDLFNDKKVEEVFSTIGFGHRTSRAFPNLSGGVYTNGQGWPRRTCIRTKKYRLDKNVRIDGDYVGKEDEDIFFVDVTKDPTEKINMVGWPEYKDIVDILLKKINQHINNSVEPCEKLCIR